MTRRPPGPTFPPPHIDLHTEFEAAFERPYPAIEWLTMLLQERDRLRALLEDCLPSVSAAHAIMADLACDHGEDCFCDEQSRVRVLLERARAELGKEAP